MGACESEMLDNRLPQMNTMIKHIFSPADVAKVVKAVFLLGGDRYRNNSNNDLRFTPTAMSHICALAGLSESQAQALNHELGG